MPTSKSAEKRLRQSEKSRLRNRRRRNLVKADVRSFEAALAAGDMDQAQQQLRQVCKRLDQVAAKGTIHKNTAARGKSRLSRRLQAAAH